MAANINAELNLNSLLEQLLDNPYGLFAICLVIGLIIVISAVFFLAKSGILSSIREHQEYKMRRIKDEIKDQEELLEDESFKKYKHQIKYHLDVTKLNKLLKYSHFDKDLLEYILSCKNSRLAIFYYESSNFYLEKDSKTKQFKLKKYCSGRLVNGLNSLGTFLYFGISFGSLSPVIYTIFLCIRAGESLSKIPNSFFFSQFFLFIISITLGLMLMTPLVKPWKAMKFLELEKIEQEQAEAKEAQKAA